MLSLAAVPPFSLFWGKINLMSSAVNAGYVWLAVVMGLNSAIAAFYYLKLIVYMFLKEPTAQVNESTTYYNVSKPLLTILGFAVFVTVGSMFYVDPLLEVITEMIKQSGIGFN
jgi:NADH-quinone oxidoreductase subunit N